MPGDDLASVDFPFRFKVVNVVPVAAVLLMVGAVVLAGAPGEPPQRQVLLGNAREFGWAGAAGALAAIVVIALLAEPLELASIRFLEGYWPTSGPLGRIHAAGLRSQQRRFTRLTFLADRSTDLELRHLAAVQRDEQFPPEIGRLLPTALGNRLRAFEDRAGQAYGVEAVPWWPRLHHVLPDQVRGTVDRHRDQLDVASRLTIAWAVGAVALAGLLAPHWTWWWLPALSAALSWFAYRSALGAAGVYGTAVTAAIDVYRLHLLQEMRIRPPADTDAERVVNEKLLLLWLGDDEVNVQYQTTDSDHNLRIT
jgi:hypothetical protein